MVSSVWTVLLVLRKSKVLFPYVWDCDQGWLVAWATPPRRHFSLVPQSPQCLSTFVPFLQARPRCLRIDLKSRVQNRLEKLLTLLSSDCMDFTPLFFLLSNSVDLLDIRTLNQIESKTFFQLQFQNKNKTNKSIRKKNRKNCTQKWYGNLWLILVC